MLQERIFMVLSKLLNNCAPSYKCSFFHNWFKFAHPKCCYVTAEMNNYEVVYSHFWDKASLQKFRPFTFLPLYSNNNIVDPSLFNSYLKVNYKINDKKHTGWIEKLFLFWSRLKKIPVTTATIYMLVPS